MYTWEEIEQLDHAELFNLLSEYDRYVTEILERNTSDKPVCVSEFYENEYQLIQEGEMQSYNESNEDYMRFEKSGVFCPQCGQEATYIETISWNRFMDKDIYECGHGCKNAEGENFRFDVSTNN